jgi:predicted alpha/beta hydrolase
MSVEIPSEDIDVTAADGWHLKASLFKPSEEAAAKSVILVLPAMGSHSRPARFMASALAAAGHAVLTADLRGHGRSLPKPKRGIDYGFDSFLRQDIPAFLATAKALYPHRPVFIIGHSLGGILGSIFAAENPGALQGVIALTTANLSLTHLSKGSLTIFVPFYLIAKVMGYVPGQHLGWGNPIAKTQVIDWAGWAFRRELRGSDGRALEPALANSTTPMLCLGFSDDYRLAPPKVVKAFADLFPAHLTEHRTITPQEAGVETLGHLNHLRNGAYVWRQMDAWITAQIKS